MTSFIPKFFFALTMLLSFSAHASLQKSLISQQLAYENIANQHVEIVGYDIARDFEAVKNIMKENWAMLVGSGPYDELLVYKCFVQNISANRSGQKTIIKVARVNGQIAGFMTFVPNNFWHNYGMVELLAVGSEFRNKGIGYKLLSAAQELAQKNNAQGLELYVCIHNKPAITLYEKFGLRRAAFASGNTALMAKSFNSPEPYPMIAQIPAASLV